MYSKWYINLLYGMYNGKQWNEQETICRIQDSNGVKCQLGKMLDKPQQ